MRIAGLVIVFFFAFMFVRACETGAKQQRAADIEAAERLIRAATPDTIPPLAIKPVDPAQIKRAAAIGGNPSAFCHALGKSLRTDKDPEFKRAMIERASREFASTLKFGQQSEIRQKRVSIGMTTCMAIAAWGRPERINQSVGGYGLHEQWAYPANYLYFEDGILKSYQSQL